MEQSSLDILPWNVFENVCIAVVEKDDNVRQNVIYSYTIDGKSIGNEFVVDDASWADWVTKTEGRYLSDWKQDSSDILIEDETLLMLSLWGNPAHCLTDQVFSISVDIQTRNLEKRGQHHTFYPSFLTAGWSHLPKQCSKKDWCCQFTDLIGIISRKNRFSAPPELSPICFRRLVVPHHAAYRFPSQDPIMLQSLKMLQNMALDATGLAANQWSKREIPRNKPILLYDRRGTTSRILKNSHRIAQLLETKYHTKVTLVGKEWNNFIKPLNTVTAQASFYNKFPYIISPHGAHFTNLLFARRGTKVMEIDCWIPGSRPVGELFLNLTRREQATNEDEWFGEPTPLQNNNWFSSFSRKLGVEHFVYSEFEGCMMDGTLEPYGKPKSLTVDEERFTSFVASRFQLRPRRARRKEVASSIVL